MKLTKKDERSQQQADSPSEDTVESDESGRISYTASLITQGKHRFYTLSMPSDVLAENCIVEKRAEDPTDGFQRALDEKRAREIAQYIDSGFGTIPGSIVLSAQDEADLEYRRQTRTISFNADPRAFLILDGQHRVFGFKLAKSRLRVPVVIYNGLTRVEECRLFMDINTKQRPVPTELLLDIKRLADTESGTEELFRNVYDLFDREPSSPLFGLMSPSEKKKGKISRVTFKHAMNSISDAFSGSNAEYIFEVYSSYLHACVSGLRQHSLQANITNPILFRSLALLFPTIAERVADRHGEIYSTANFDEIVQPMFQRIKAGDLQKPGASINHLHDIFRKALRSGFTIGRGSQN